MEKAIKKYFSKIPILNKINPGKIHKIKIIDYAFIIYKI